MKGKNSMIARNEFIVSKAVRIEADHLDNLLVSGHVDDISIVTETDSEIHVMITASFPKKALEGKDYKEAILSSNYFLVGEIPQTAITKEMTQVCDVIPAGAVKIRYEDTAIKPNISNKAPEAPKRRKK
jgi:hypothetical protein